MTDTNELRGGVLAWLREGSDYLAGLALLKKTGVSSSVLLTVLERGENSFSARKIQEALGLWLELPSAEPVAVQAPSAPVRQALLATAYGLMDRRSELKARIRALADVPDAQADRRDAAYGVKRLTREIDAVYEQVAFWDEHGYVPPATVQEPTTVVADMTTLLNVRTYISRYRAKAKTAKTSESRAGALVKLAEYELELTRLTEQMKRYEP